MTMIISGFASKKTLKEAAANGQDFFIEDPALMPEWRKYGARFKASSLPIGAVIVATNHPKRSWFAEIRMTPSGIKVV